MTDYRNPQATKPARFVGGSRDGRTEDVPLATNGQQRESIALPPVADAHPADGEPHEIVTRFNPEVYDWNGDNDDPVYSYRPNR